MDIKNKWNQFASSGVVIFTIAATFMVATPLLQLNTNTRIDWFVKFLIACLIALFTIPLLKRSKRSDYKFWYRLAGFSFILTIIIVGIYAFLVINWSVPFYNDKRLVIGKTMSAEAQLRMTSLAEKLHRPVVDEETLVKARKGETHYIWPKAELQARYFGLIAFYILSFLLIAIFIISVIQAIYCYEKDT
jgi:hypothetical protein